jgi:predicted Ser/Thr protein kinase
MTDQRAGRGAALPPTDPLAVGPYRVVARLGQGGMGTVYLARDPDDRPVAVKVVRADLAAEPEFRQRFHSEVARARAVPPFCTAEVLDADPEGTTPYLVVEYVDGPSLAEAVEEDGPLTAGNLHALAIGVATALAAIHGAGVLHRDLKPRNVLLAPGSPKVIDLGIARALDGRPCDPIPLADRLRRGRCRHHLPLREAEHPVTTDIEAPPRTPADRLARLASEVFAPAVWAAGMPVVIALHATAPAWKRGLGWGLLAVLFCSLVPYGIIWLGVRRGQLTDHHIGVREQRRMPLLYGLTSVLIGLGALILLGAPRRLVAMVVVMFAVLLVVTAINQMWKLSAHAAVTAGAISILVVVFGPALCAALLVLGLVGWSRVRLHDHTTGQVLAGALVGAVIAVPTYLLLV